MPYVDLDTIQTTDPGDILTAAWCDQVRDNFEFLDDPPAASVFHSSSVSLTHNTQTILAADSENFDNDAMHSTVTNNSRITIQTAGRYLFTASLVFATTTAGNRQGEFLVNGVAAAGGTLLPPAPTNSTSFIVVRLFALSVADYVEVRATQRSGAALNVGLIEFSANRLTR